ncbi:hypothetical protein ATKI12_8146 [Kitasatospora sp. Ki12]|uniref:cold-shock protein n=1 Tax=Kitasatospora xanthocidica TaxID=83382 RepID=UPI0016759F39|nr:cold shock domain-containing protein [Kitasatospora xanthocidica]GHF89343.1 DNA-binding protein [Kitasatospora xanthocidica]
MTVGRVIRFDEARGYGFITPMEGGADVFVHANDLVTADRELRPGVRVSFEIFSSDRGLKAYAVQVIGEAEATARLSSPRRPVGRATPLAEAQYRREVAAVISTEDAALTPQQASSLCHRLVDVARRQGWLHR